MDQREIAALMAKHREPAIMAYRPYPPVNLPPVNSHLGGCPVLPAGYDWPRTSGGEPLHFLAQIDCAELPPSGGVLPDKGALFFFARIDEEMLWGDGDPKDDCRVVFAPRIGLSEARAPDDLPPLMGGYSDLQSHFALPDDPPVTLYPRWPLVFRGLSSWPDMTAIRGAWKTDFKGYQTSVRQARAAEVSRVLDMTLEEERGPSWRKGASSDKVTLPGDVGSQFFPQAWIMVDRIARYLVTGPVASLRRTEVKTGISASFLSMTENAAKRWIETARQRGRDKPVDPASAKEFTTWLHEVANHDLHMRSGLATAVAVGMRSTVQCAASSPSVAALIPRLYYGELESQHRPARLWRFGPITAPLEAGLTHSYHQMLGNAGSTQQARSVERDEVLLLQLNSDYGVNFMFCDVGEVEFWISKADLAARRYDRVFATTCGG
jgi:hypothetical protein